MTYTLYADGGSDVVLIPILDWSLKRNGVTSIVSQPADLARLPPRYDTEQRLNAVLDLYPCDILFFHRDAEGQPASRRRQEIAGLLRGAEVRHVPVIPVRMTEAWLLVDEKAIRSAAGNPNGTEPLQLPNLGMIEKLPDPKDVLLKALATASGLNVRRRSLLRVHERVHRIPEYMSDYSRLLSLSAFATLQKDIQEVLPRMAV